MFSEKDKNYLGEMFEQQTKTLIEHVDGVVTEVVDGVVEAVDGVMTKHVKDLRFEIRELSTKIDDTKANLRVETDKKIAEHVTAGHAA